MDVTVIAKSDRGVFVGLTDDGDFVVFSLDDTRPIELGNRLCGHFGGSESTSRAVRNATTGETVQICAENWECTWHTAVDHLRRIGDPSEFWSLDSHPLA